MSIYRECCFKSQPSKKKLIWEITNSCSSHCDYCFQEKKRTRNPAESLRGTDLVQICEKIQDLHISEVLITGGEIAGKLELIDAICSVLRKKEIPVSFSTAQLNNEDFIQKLFSYGPTAINISYDPASTADDTLLPYVDNLLELADSRQIKIKITGVITQRNVQYITSYLATLRTLIMKHPSLSAVYVTNPYDIGYISRAIRVDDQTLLNILLSISHDVSVNSHISLVNFHKFSQPLQRCFAGSKFVHLEPNGNVYPCHLLANLDSTTFLMGNVISSSRNEINQKLDAFRFNANRSVEDYKKVTPKCTTCKTSNKCGGGCLAEQISQSSSTESQLICGKDVVREAPFKFDAIDQVVARV